MLEAYGCPGLCSLFPGLRYMNTYGLTHGQLAMVSDRGARMYGNQPVHHIRAADHGWGSPNSRMFAHPFAARHNGLTRSIYDRRRAGFGALLPVAPGATIGRSCPTPAVRNTCRDRLNRVDSGPSPTRVVATGLRRNRSLASSKSVQLTAATPLVSSRAGPRRACRGGAVQES